jgi:hypothetical protein
MAVTKSGRESQGVKAMQAKLPSFPNVFAALCNFN